ncbi:MAG: serine hydrolase [Kangiellaceae bacterium]
MFRLLLIIGGLIFVNHGNAATASANIETIKALINHKIEKEQQAVGATVVLIEHGKTEYLNFGLTNQQDNTATTSSALFEIGSISKTFTSIALASMVKEGKVKLNDPVQKYLPSKVKIPTRNGKVITLESLANHTSALPRLPSNMPYNDPLDPYADYTIELMYEFLNNYQLTRDIGEKLEYSNLAVGLLGHALSLIDGKSYQQMITDRVLIPLSMSNTFVDVPASHASQQSDGHDAGLNKTKHWKLPALAGAGALNSNAKDMALYLGANLNPSKALRQTSLIEAISLSHQKTIDAKKHGASVGLGWFIAEHKNGSYLWHNGGTGGFRSFMGFDQENQRGIIILENSANGMDNIGNAILTGNLAKLKSDILEVHSLDENQLSKFVGHYELAPGMIMTVTQKRQQLFIQLTGQANYPVYAKSDLEFVYRVVEAKVKFELNEKGESVSLTLFQGGAETKAKRLSEKDAAAKMKRVELTNEQLDNLVGQFEIMPNFIITTSHQDGQLVIQATGQPKIPFETKSRSEFFNGQVQARIVFELDKSGKAISLTLFQAGQELKGDNMQ